MRETDEPLKGALAPQGREEFRCVRSRSGVQLLHGFTVLQSGSHPCSPRPARGLI